MRSPERTPPSQPQPQPHADDISHVSHTSHRSHWSHVSHRSNISQTSTRTRKDSRKISELEDLIVEYQLQLSNERNTRKNLLVQASDKNFELQTVVENYERQVDKEQELRKQAKKQIHHLESELEESRQKILSLQKSQHLPPLQEETNHDLEEEQLSGVVVNSVEPSLVVEQETKIAEETNLDLEEEQLSGVVANRAVASLVGELESKIAAQPDEKQESSPESTTATATARPPSTNSNNNNAKLVAENIELNRNMEALIGSLMDQQFRIDALEQELKENQQQKEEEDQAVLQQTDNSSIDNNSTSAADKVRIQGLEEDLEFLKDQVKDQQLQIGAGVELRNALQELVEALKQEQEMQKNSYLAQIQELQDNLREEQQMHLETILNYRRQVSAENQNGDDKPGK